MNGISLQFKLDYTKLNGLLDKFLQQHHNELTIMVGQCLVLLTDDAAPTPPAIENKRPSLSEDIPNPEDSLDNLFLANTNTITTRYKDRQT